MDTYTTDEECVRLYIRKSIYTITYYIGVTTGFTSFTYSLTHSHQAVNFFPANLDAQARSRRLWLHGMAWDWGLGSVQILNNY